MLRGLTTGEKDERLLVGPESFDDAGIVDLRGVEGLPADTNVALVQTVDYFPPVVDDPYFYGAIAAANSLSDVYAMGGKPLSALNLAGIPRDFPKEWTAEVFRGGFEKMREARCMVAGGHTVASNEALFGFAVTGIVDRRRVAANSGAKLGDRLYLTKSLGMGTLTTAGKRQKLSWKELEPAARQMATLNSLAADAMNAVRAHAATDITGFGLVGHARNIAAASAVTLRLELARMPLFERAHELASAGFLSGGAKRGRKGLAEDVSIRAGLDETLVNLAFDAETSGGLLIAVSAENAPALERELAARSQLVCALGEVLPRAERLIELV
ncbi:MAG: selenide, water dikinase SelD [Planctomycetes bacterium]|nr:selenide, water dikinase SelD [Planctomycetota bacterium]